MKDGIHPTYYPKAHVSCAPYQNKYGTGLPRTVSAAGGLWFGKNNS